jgi:enterochelin esterase family protein
MASTDSTMRFSLSGISGGCCMLKQRTAMALTWLAVSAACWCPVRAQTAPLQPESPRLHALATALGDSDGKALETFWNDVTSTHTPLIEPIPGHPQDALYTFIWRAEPGQVAVNVLFNGWFPLHKASGFDPFTRLGESNVWYTSYALPRTVHIRY